MHAKGAGAFGYFEVGKVHTDALTGESSGDPRHQQVLQGGGVQQGW